MTPILYSSDEIDFLNNGLGQLVDLYDVDIHEQRNGLLNLTAYYPVNGQHYADISEGNIILAKPSPLDDNHAFRIVSVALDITGYAVMIEADSITYDLTNNLSKTIHMLGDGQAAMTAIQNSTLHPHIFTFYSDITHTSESQLRYVNPMEAIAGTQGSFLQIWGGELKRENRRVAMFNRRGRDNVATFRLGKNIAGLKYTVDVSNLTTEIVPTVTVNSTDVSRTIDGATVQSSRMGNYPLVYSKMVDVSQDVKVDEGDTDDQIKAKINAFAADWFVKSANTGKDLPEVTVEVEVESLQDSADYADKFAKLETIGLTDTVTVYVPEFGVNVTAIVNELHYDPVAERVTKLSIGTSKVSWADSNKNALNDLQDKVTEVKEQANQAVVSANGKSKNHYGRDAPEHPQEGDTWFWNDGENSGVKVWVNGKWVDSVDTQTNERIDNAVNSAVSEAKAHADSLNSAQASTANSISTSAAAALASASTARSILASNASSMANSAAAKGSSAANSAYTAAMSGATDAVNVLSSGVGVAITSTADSLNGKLTTAITSANVTASSYATVARNEAIATASQNTTTITSAAISSYGSKVASMYVTNTTFNQTVSGIQMAATQLETQVNAMGQVNQLFNTEFSPDMQGWNVASDSYLQVMIDTERYDGSGVMKFKSTQGNTTWRILAQQRISAAPGQSWSASTMLKLISTSNNQSLVGQAVLAAFDNSGTRLNGFRVINTQADVHDWEYFKIEDFVTPVGTAFIGIQFWSGNSVEFEISKIMLTNNEIIGDYTQGNYNNNARVSSLELDVDGISGVVNNPSKGLSATWNLANNGQTIAVQASNAATTALTTAQGVQTTVNNWKTATRNYIANSNNVWITESDQSHQVYSFTVPAAEFSGKTITVSVQVDADGAIGKRVGIEPVFTTNGTNSGLYAGKWLTISTATTTNKRIYGTWTLPDNITGIGQMQLYIQGVTSGTVKLSKPMLTMGNVLTDWQPAPEDTDNAIQSVRTQLAGQITDEVANRTNGDNSVRTQLTDLVNQQVTSVTNGYKTAITQASDAIMASVSGVNLFTFSRFEDSGNNKWPGARLMKGTISKWAYFNSGNNAISVTSTANWDGFYHSNIPVTPGQAFSASVVINNNGRNDNAGRLDVWFVKTDGTRISQGGNVGIGTQAGWITAKIENMIVPDGAAYMQVSLVNAMPTSSGSFFVMPMVNVGSKALPYTPDVAGQTALQLFADSFTLSLKDNIGNIISGINGDTSGMTIAAKKLTVSADTTFLGNNWLNGAIIKNASIGGAQIAKASITDANILNLDVNKISGEVANFIRAYWDGQYGSTSITSEGMTVSAGVTTTVFDENGMQLNKSNRSVGRIGVNDLYQDNSKKGLYFGLESTGDFMAWGAQNYAGNPYTTKLSWFRAGAVPSNLPGLIEGFNFEDNVAFINPVEMRGGIKLQGANDRLLVRASNLNGGSYPTFGGPSAYFVYAGSDIYLSSNGTAINLTKIAKAFGGIRTAAIPTGFNSNGTATGWYNVDMG